MKTFNIFTTEQKPMGYVKTPGMYSSNPRAKRLFHMSVSELAVRLWKEALLGEDKFDKVDHKAG